MPRVLAPDSRNESINDGNRLLTIKDVSKITGLAVGTLYHLAAEGRIRKRPEWTALTIGMGHFSVQTVTLDQVR
jgi:predicted DNA-binding transcriptional regulator AlpA